MGVEGLDRAQEQVHIILRAVKEPHLCDARGGQTAEGAERALGVDRHRGRKHNRAWGDAASPCYCAQQGGQEDGVWPRLF